MIANFTRDLGLSATPVREALSRLAGEGLIEDRRGAGYFASRLDGTDLTGLYDLSWTYLAAAMLAAGDHGFNDMAGEWIASPPPAARDSDVVARTEAMFDTLMARSRNPALRRGQRLLSDRLAAARRAEPAVLPDVAQEIGALEQAIAVSGAELGEYLLAYHDRRRQAAGDIISALRSKATGIFRI
jgi:hypothetical protein